MSGTSLDGLDMCYTEFNLDNGKWSYKILEAESEEYPADIKEKLANAQKMTALEYALFNSDYGLYVGRGSKSSSTNMTLNHATLPLTDTPFFISHLKGLQHRLDRVPE
jgi:anhydro-N-acetylmuramic acid kinase